MSEETKMSAFKAFQQNLQTFTEAEEKAKLEAGAPKVERFRIGEDGDYLVRVLPLAPTFDKDGNILPMDRKGYDYALHQFFLTIKVPSKKGGKEKKMNIPVIRATNEKIGHSLDLIDTYLRIAKEKYSNDEDLLEKISSNSYSGGLRWNYQHAIMVLDVSSDKERAKGPQLWQCSHSQYKSISEAEMRLWKELQEDGEQPYSPIAGLTDSYPVKVIRQNSNKKTEYTFEIGRKFCDITEDEAQKLIDLPRIPELIYRYTRYQMEATLEFLKQYDEAHDMDICSQPDFIEAVETLKGEMPADDTSHFSMSGGSAKGSTKTDEVTLESLWAEYDAILDQELGEKSEEYQDLREKIRQFIVDNELDVRISRTKNNQQLLEEIEEAFDNGAKPKAKAEEAEAEEEKPSAKKAADVKEEEDDDEEEDEPEPTPQPKEEAPRQRRARPSADEKPAPEPEPESEPEKEPQDEQPARRLHARRMR